MAERATGRLKGESVYKKTTQKSLSTSIYIPPWPCPLTPSPWMGAKSAIVSDARKPHCCLSVPVLQQKDSKNAQQRGVDLLRVGLCANSP